MKNIEKIIKLVKKEVSKYELPFVSEIGNINGEPYLTLISCLLSLRTKDEVTAKASKRLFAFAKTPKQLVKLNIKKIESLIYPVGFYKTKARRIKDISKELIEKYNSKVPKDFDKLMEFKGVGRKTANIVMTYGHKKSDYIPVDIHCHRIPNRIGWIATKTPDETELELKKIIPKKYWMDFNNSFVLFGQNICVPVSPHCSICTIEKYCKKNNVKKSR